MPYVTEPKCAICGKVHPKDTNDTVQMFNHQLGRVDVCKNHRGTIEEANRQNSLGGTDAGAKLAREEIATPQFRKDLHDYLIRTQTELSRLTPA